MGISTLDSGTITQDIDCEVGEAFFIHDSDIKAMGPLSLTLYLPFKMRFDLTSSIMVSVVSGLVVNLKATFLNTAK